MLSRSAISIRKQDVLTQKSTGSVPQKVMFAHQLTLGDTSFNLSSLVTPTAAMPGFTNPSAITLAGAQIYVNQTGVTLWSSVRGPLCYKAQYTIDSNTQINFVGWTAEDTEWIWGTIDSQKPGLHFVDATQICQTHLLTAGYTEIITGAYPLNMFPTEQVGAITVFAGGVPQLRNSGNAAASPTADGNYHETGSSIIFNTPFAEDTPVIIVSTGLLVNNPADSRDAALDALAGQMDLVVADLAQATGNPVSRYQTTPNKPDLTAFGGRVATLEAALAALPSTFGQPGMPGEVKESYVSSAYQLSTATVGLVWNAGSGTPPYVDLDKGKWDLFGWTMLSPGAGTPTLVELSFYNRETASGFGYGNTGKYPSSGSEFPKVTAQGVVTVASGIQRVYLRAVPTGENAASTFYVGSGGGPAGYIKAVRLSM